MMMENNIGIEVVVLLDYLKHPVLTYKGVVIYFQTPDVKIKLRLPFVPSGKCVPAYAVARIKR